MLPVLILGLFVVSSNARLAPDLAPFITPCKGGDNACVLRSAQEALPYFAAGIPDLGVPPCDPLVLDDVRADEGDLQLQFKNMHVSEIKGCKFLTADLADDFTHLAMSMECPITATGQYEAGGKLMFIPIEGKGDIEVKTEKIKLSFKAQINNVKGSDGKHHWSIVNFEHEYEPQEQIYFRLDNLFGGDQEKAQAVHDILHLSGKEVMKTIGKPIIDEIIHKAFEHHIKVFLQAVPAEELTVA